MSSNTLVRTLFAGTLATLAMSGFAAMAPMMGMPPMDPAAMLAAQMGDSLLMGWAAHLMVGNGLAVGFVLWARERLPGPMPARGALFAVAPWLVAQVVMMPMMGMGLFSGSALLAGGSLVGHLVYGAVLGVAYRPAEAPSLARGV